MQQLHKFSQQEHLRLQQKYNSLTARAEADTKGTRELLFRLSNVEEELPKFKAALAQYKEESRQLHDNNSRLSQVSHFSISSCTLRRLTQTLDPKMSPMIHLAYGLSTSRLNSPSFPTLSNTLGFCN